MSVWRPLKSPLVTPSRGYMAVPTLAKWMPDLASSYVGIQGHFLPCSPFLQLVTSVSYRS